MVAFYTIYDETAVKMHSIRQISSYNRLKIVENGLRSIKNRLKASLRDLKRLKSVLERLKRVLRAS